MATTPLRERVEPLLREVEHPSRYIGSEFGSHASIEQSVPGDVLVGLCYPGTYEVGQANQALHILYAQLSSQQQVAVERVFLPWIDLIDLMRERGVELFTLESYFPVKELDILGITLPNEMAATSVLEVLDLAGIPLHADRRTVSDPLVIGGGPCAFNPEPLAPFFDAFFIGEGENAIIEIVEVVRQTKAKGFAREQQLAALSALEGIYVPSLYDKSSADPIKKRIARDFATIAGPNDRIVPFVDVVHDRCSIEILRGCNRGCRFCQAGMTYRPARERSADTIIRAALKGVERTGYDEVSLTSLSSTDHSQIAEIVRRLNASLASKGVSVSLPSLRVDSFSIDLMNVLTSGSKRPALTLAPEAGTQRMRDIINKNVTEEQVLDMVRSAFEVGYLRVKLYFMIGLPHETDEDIVGIAQLVQKVSEVAHDSVEPKKRGAVKVALSVSSFVPKAHTPFQWAQQDSVAEIERKQDMLKAALPRKGVQLSYHDAHTSHIEGLIARGDATLAPVIEAAWRAGARFEAYAEQFDYALWQQAFEATGFDPDHNAEPRKPGEPLAWDHISTGVSTEYLMQEAQNAQKSKLTLDCTFKSCTTCGVCQNLGTAIDIKADRG